MPKQRSPERDKAFEVYKEHNGKIANRQIAKQLGVPERSISGWKAKDNWEGQLNGVLPKRKRSTPKKRGAPKGNKNALGNKGGGPLKNKKAEKHGFFSRIMPDDPETMAIVESIETKSPLDILWENIVIQYTAIARGQRLMFVKDKEDLTKVLKREKESSGQASDSWEKEYELQFAWDKQAAFLQAQARAMKTLESLIARYDEMLPGALKHTEQQLRIEKLKSEIGKIKQPESAEADDGFIEALKSGTAKIWADDQNDRDDSENY